MNERQRDQRPYGDAAIMRLADVEIEIMMAVADVDMRRLPSVAKGRAIQYGNLILSPLTYIAAGFLWNLEATENNQATFSFLRRDWPSRPWNAAFHPLLWASLPFVLVGSFVLTAFVKWYFN